MKKSILLIILFLIIEATAAYKFSGIDIINMVGEYPSCHYDAIHTNRYGVVSDGLDIKDFIVENDFCEECYLGGGYVYSEVEDQKCLYDYRPWDSNVPFNIKLFCCLPNLSSDVNNRLWVNYYVDDQNETFGDKTIIFESDRLIYGFAVDVRRIIEIGCPYKRGGMILLIPVVAGHYNIINPYGSAVLHIGTRSLGDFNADGICDLADFAELAADWQKPQGKYKSDISGVDGIPDGFVDYYDLVVLIEQGWLANFQ